MSYSEPYYDYSEYYATEALSYFKTVRERLHHNMHKNPHWRDFMQNMDIAIKNSGKALDALEKIENHYGLSQEIKKSINKELCGDKGCAWYLNEVAEWLKSEEYYYKICIKLRESHRRAVRERFKWQLY